MSPAFHIPSIKETTFSVSNYLLNRNKILWNYKNLISSEWYPQEILREIQLRKLKGLVEYANAFIPYYKKKFKEIGFYPRDIKSLEDVKFIPPLSRKEVIDHHKEMVATPFCNSIRVADQRKSDPGAPIPFAVFKRHKLLKNTSSGSIGAPTIFYEDGSRAALNWAHELRLKSWYGIKPLAKEGRMVRLSTLPNNRVLQMRKVLWNQLILPGVNLRDEDYETCLRAILEFMPKVLWGYTPALSGLAEYIYKNKKNLFSYRPDLAVGWASPVYEHEERILRKVFECPISNNYGSREVGHVAGKCPSDSFHVNQESFLVEIGRQTDGDEHNGTGEILVTTLDESPMPFIRYRMGDLGELTDSKCPCGRNLQILKNLLGRTGEVFVTQNGRMISPNFWCRTFMADRLSGAIKRFQIVYTRDGDIRIRIVKNDHFSSETESYLREFLEKNFDPSTKIEFVYTGDIPPQISGKYQMVIHEGNSSCE
jgi:phenylacetate-CoA ligase